MVSREIMIICAMGLVAYIAHEQGRTTRARIASKRKKASK